MIPYVRQNQIYEYIKMKQIAYLDELADFVKVSKPTVRRDLKKLQEDNKIIILNGGGVRISESETRSVLSRLEQNSEQKYLVCNCASKYIKENDLIYLGPGSTENYLIDNLVEKNVTVVTNGMFHIPKLQKYKINTILIGGQLDNDLCVTYGCEVLKAIYSYRFDKCFIGASGIRLDGITSFDKGTSIIVEAVLKNSIDSFLLADNSKFQKQSNYKFAEIDDFDKIITADKVPDDLINFKNIIISTMDK